MQSTNQGASVDHAAKATYHEGKARDASRRLGLSIVAAGTMFGDAVSDHFTRLHEHYAEHAGEATWHLRQRLAEVEDTRDRLVRSLMDEAEQRRFKMARDRALLVAAIDELERRAKKARRPVPQIVTEFRANERADDDGTPF